MVIGNISATGQYIIGSMMLQLLWMVLAGNSQHQHDRHQGTTDKHILPSIMLLQVNATKLTYIQNLKYNLQSAVNEYSE